MEPQHLPSDLLGILGQLRTFLWVFGIALLPIAGWAIQLTFSLKQIKLNLESSSASLKGISEGQSQLEKEINEMRVVVDKNDNRVDGLTQVIRDNTHAMTKLVTLIEVMNERLRRN